MSGAHEFGGNVVALTREPLLAQLVQPYLAGRLDADAAARFEEALLESVELQEAMALHLAMRDGMESLGQVPAVASVSAAANVLARWRRWLLGV